MIRTTALLLLATAACAPSVFAQSGLGFRMDVGRQELGREWGEALDGAIDADVALLYGLRGLRAGVGVNWASMRVAGESRESWHHASAHFLLGYGHRLGRWARPFGEVRYLLRTARPEGARLFDEEAATEPIGPFRATGDGIGVRLGVEVPLTERAALSLSAEQQWFSTEPEPVEQGLGAIRGGTSRRFGSGLTWFVGADPPDGSPGSSGEPSLGLAVGVGSLGLLVPWTYNEYLKGKPFTPVSPRSWLRGVTNGFAWDDNDFDVNYHRHPYHGQFYFNAARANGYGFGRAVGHTLVGSYLWECCTETHIASIPDMVTTVVGGVAYGESIHRVSSAILDGSAHGTERILRETAAGLLNPARGISRLATGRAWRTTGPAEGRNAAAPRATVRAGARSISAPGSAPRRTLPFVDLEWTEGERLGAGRGVFSYHRIRVGLHPGDRFTLGRIEIRGALWRGEPRGSPSLRSRLAAYVDLDYLDTDARRFAAQALTGGWTGSVALGERTELGVETEASLVLLGSVDSDYARFAEIRGVRERLRLYDFGAGPGARIATYLHRDGRPAVEASYRFIALETLNGSNIEGTRSRHLLHLVRASAHQDLVAGFGLGLELRLFVQDSRYGFPDFEDSVAASSEARVHVSWRPLR